MPIGFNCPSRPPGYHKSPLCLSPSAVHSFGLFISWICFFLPRLTAKRALLVFCYAVSFTQLSPCVLASIGGRPLLCLLPSTHFCASFRHSTIGCCYNPYALGMYIFGTMRPSIGPTRFDVSDMSFILHGDYVCRYVGLWQEKAEGDAFQSEFCLNSLTPTTASPIR